MGAAQPEEWKLRGPKLALNLFLGVMVSLEGGVALAALSWATTRADVALDALRVVFLPLGILLLVYIRRIRVRADDAGLAVRRVRTRLIPWSQVDEVRLNRFTAGRSISVRLVGDRFLTLPAPVGMSAAVMEEAVEVLAERLSRARDRDLR